MNKKIKTTIVLSLLLSCLTGCFPSGELDVPSGSAVNSASGNTEESTNNSSAETKELKNLKIAIKPADNYPAEVPVIKAKRRTFNTEEIKALFLGGKTITEERNSNTGSTTFFTDDGASLNIRQDGITFIPDDHLFDGENEKRNKSRMQQTAANNIKECYHEFPNVESELDGFPRSEARSRADEFIEKLNIKYLGEPRIYTFTAEDCHSFDENIVLSKEDEFYLVRYLTTYNDIPMPQESNEIFDEVFNNWSNVDVILTKDKLVKFDCFSVFDDIEAVGTSQIKCSAETALSKLYDYYDMQVDLKNRYEYDEMNFVYITSNADFDTGEFIYSPLLCVSGKCFYDVEPETGYPYNRYIDPVTGMVFNLGY